VCVCVCVCVYVRAEKDRASLTLRENEWMRAKTVYTHMLSDASSHTHTHIALIEVVRRVLLDTVLYKCVCVCMYVCVFVLMHRM